MRARMVNPVEASVFPCKSAVRHGSGTADRLSRDSPHFIRSSAPGACGAPRIIAVPRQERPRALGTNRPSEPSEPIGGQSDRCIGIAQAISSRCSRQGPSTGYLRIPHRELLALP